MNNPYDVAIGMLTEEQYTMLTEAATKQIGLKYDDNKARMDLLDPSFTLGVAQVLTFGAVKYAPNNWRNGIPYTRIISAIHRHLAAIQNGDDFDEESGQPHIYHIGCNAQFLGWMMQNKPEFDDRYKHGS